MNPQAWQELLANLGNQSEFAVVLSRCLAVVPELSEWRATGDPVKGGLAADALDQAAGMLEQLISGEAEALLLQVRHALGELPPTISD